MMPAVSTPIMTNGCSNCGTIVSGQPIMGQPVMNLPTENAVVAEPVAAVPAATAETPAADKVEESAAPPIPAPEPETAADGT
jgi:hypothetical protein